VQAAASPLLSAVVLVIHNLTACVQVAIRSRTDPEFDTRAGIALTLPATITCAVHDCLLSLQLTQLAANAQDRVLHNLHACTQRDARAPQACWYHSCYSSQPSTRPASFPISPNNNTTGAGAQHSSQPNTTKHATSPMLKGLVNYTPAACMCLCDICCHLHSNRKELTPATNTCDDPLPGKEARSAVSSSKHSSLLLCAMGPWNCPNRGAWPSRQDPAAIPAAKRRQGNVCIGPAAMLWQCCTDTHS
jgi:hypothetical protein